MASHFLEENSPSLHHHLQDQTFQTKPLNMDTKIHQHQDTKPKSFRIDALLGDDHRPPATESPEAASTPRSISPTSSTRSRSPLISPGSEEIPTTTFVPRPGLLNHHFYPNGAAGGGFYGGYQGAGQPQQASAFHSLDTGGMVQKVQTINHHTHMHQMQLEWLARTGMFYSRLPDLTGVFF